MKAMNANHRILRPLRASPRMAGLSLLELLISLTLGLLITVAVGWVYVSGLQTYRAQDSLSRLQEGARYAFEIMGKDLRMMGDAGCTGDLSPSGAKAGLTSANVLNTNTDWYKDLFRRPLRGSNDAAPTDACTTVGTAPCYIRGDSLTALRADISQEHIVQAHATAGAQITLDNATGISAGSLLVATDCSHAAVFQATAVAGAVVDHAVSGTPGNSTINLGAGGVVHTYALGSRVYPLSAATYYIGTNPAGESALYRRVINVTPATVTASTGAEELVEGVEDMQITYGVDTDVTTDGQVNFVDPDGDGDPYLTAAQVESAAVPGATPDQQWARVVSVRISLLMRTAEDGLAPSAQTYTFNGASVTATDRRLRKVFTHVVKLRNR